MNNLLTLSSVKEEKLLSGYGKAFCELHFKKRRKKQLHCLKKDGREYKVVNIKYIPQRK